MLLLRAIRFHLAMTVSVVIVALVMALVMFRDNISLIFLIFMTGYAGGIISTYLRVKDVPAGTTQLDNPTANRIAILQVYVSPLVSGFFGLVFYALCLTGIISGSIFPDFDGLDTQYQSVWCMFQVVQPAMQVDAAKAILWGFVAGFSERLVPNVLDKMARTSAE